MMCRIHALPRLKARISRIGLSMAILGLGYVPGLSASVAPPSAPSGLASWYNRASCRREGTSGIMANGRALDDEAYTAASWDYPFGTTLRVCVASHQPNHCILVEVADRGPARRLYKRGRILDLSQAAFEALAPLSQGIIAVTIEQVK